LQSAFVAMRIQKGKVPMKTIALALVGAMSVACYPASGSEPQIWTAVSASAPLTEYRTFSFGLTEEPPAGYEESARSLEVERRAREVVGTALRQRGYIEENTKPSFVVRLGAGTRRVDTGGYREVDPMRRSEDDEDFVDFQKVNVDIYDASTKTKVWRASVVSLVDLTKAIDSVLLQKDVQGMLAAFPVRTMKEGEPAAASVATVGAR
jgi:hypothetical protein